MRRSSLLVLGLLGVLAVDTAAQSSQESGLHISTVSSPSPGGIQVLVSPTDTKVDSQIGASPNAKDFTVWLGGGAAPNLSVARNGGRGKPLTSVIMIDMSGSYKTKYGEKEALPAIAEYIKDAGTDELALVVFSLDVKDFPISVGPDQFSKDVAAAAGRVGRATSVTIALERAFEIVAKEGEPGLREVLVFTDGLDEASVDAAAWAGTIQQARELGVRVHVILPTEQSLPAFKNQDDHKRWVTTTTSLNRLATESGGVYLSSRDPQQIATKLRDARVAMKSALVLEGKLCGAKSGQPVDVRVEYVPGAKREAWSGGAQLPAAAWAPGSDAPCPSLCAKPCSAWEECIAGTCAARSCTNDGACAGGAVCLAGVCGKACSPACAGWQECRGGACAARACAGDESCGAGSTCKQGTCTPPQTKSNKLIWILAAAGVLLLLAALFVLFRKKPAPAPVVETPAPPEPMPEPEPEKKKPVDAGVDLDPLPETHLVAIGGWTTPGERWRLHKRKTIAGASSDAGDGVDLVFGIKQVSGRHAQFDLYPSGDLWVTDLGSSNGTFVNGKKLTAKERTKLVVGDQIKLSQNLILVVERPGASSTDDATPVAKTEEAPASTPAGGPKAATKFDPGGR